MGRFAAVGAALLVLWLALGGVACGSGPSEREESGPEWTVRQMFDAIEAGDWQRASGYMTGVMAQSEWSNSLTEGMIDSVDIENMELTVTSESENKVTLRAEYDIQITFTGGFTLGKQNVQTVELVKVDDLWLVSLVVGSG